MKRLLVLTGLVVLAAGCSSQNAQSGATPTPEGSLRLGAGDELGWRLQAHDRAITSASAEERDLAAHE